MPTLPSPAVATAPAPAQAPVGPAGRERKLRHIGALDGLRGAAVAGVLLFHGGHLRGGYLGVDLFFVLSGYLITMLLLREFRNTRRIALSHFWARRARRLFPALVLMLLLVAAYAKFVAIPEELGGIRADSFAALFYVANWHSILSGHSYFQAGIAPSPLEHTWSLAIEEQFYVLWPLIVVALLRWRRRPDTILRAALAIAAGSVALMVGLHVSGVVSDNSLYLGTHTRIGGIAMGAALAAWQVAHGHTKDRTSRLGLEALGIVSLLFLAIAWSRLELGSGLVYAGGLATCGLAVVSVIAAASHPVPMVISRALSVAPLRWLGRISYGAYLYHWPIYLYLNEFRTGLRSWWLLALQTLVTLVVASLSYYLVERPIRYGAVSGRASRAAAAAGAAVATVAILLATVGAVPAITQGAGALAAAGGSDPVMLLVGDSVPYVLGTEGIVPLRRELKVSVADEGRIGCLAMASAGPAINLKTNEADAHKVDCTFRFPGLITKYRPNLVMLLYGTLDDFDIVVGGVRRDQCDPAYEDASRRLLERQVDELSKGGATVVLVTAPGVTDPEILSLFKVPDSPRRAGCSNDVIRKVAAADHRTRLVDLAEFVCPGPGPCIDQYHGTKLRPDGVHYRGDIAKYVARWLVPRALAAARQAR